MIIISLHRMQSDLAEGAYAAEEADDAEGAEDADDAGRLVGHDERHERHAHDEGVQPRPATYIHRNIYAATC